MNKNHEKLTGGAAAKAAMREAFARAGYTHGEYNLRPTSLAGKRIYCYSPIQEWRRKPSDCGTFFAFDPALKLIVAGASYDEALMAIALRRENVGFQAFHGQQPIPAPQGGSVGVPAPAAECRP